MHKPIRVLHTEWSGGWGGQEIRIINEMLAVQKRGVDVSLACASHTPIYQKAKALGITVFDLPFRGTMDFRTLFGLMKIIRQHDIDIVNTHSGKDTWVGGLAAKFTKRKFIRTRHLSYPVSTSRLNFINELADCVITTGEKTRQDMIRVNRIKPDRIVAIPSGPDAEIYMPGKYDTAAIKKRLGIKPKAVVIGVVAFMRKMKRLDIFLEVAHRIVQEYPHTRFVMVGDGSGRAEVEKKIAELKLDNHVVLTGMLENPADIMATFDIAMLTSDRGEVSPQSLIQYLLTCIPTICTNVGSVSDFLSDGNFIMVEPNDIDALTKHALTLIANPEKRQDLRLHCEQNRKAFAKRFSLTAMVDKTLQVYDKVLQRDSE